MLVLLAYARVVILTTLADSQQNQHDIYLLRVYSVEIILVVDSGHVRNMQSTLSNKSEKQCTSLAFTIRIYHNARSSELKKKKSNEDILLKPNVLIVLWSVAVKLLFRCIKLHFIQGMQKSRESGFNCEKFCRAAPNILGGFLYGTCFKSTFGRLNFGGGVYIFFAKFIHPCFSSHIYLFISTECSSGHNNQILWWTESDRTVKFGNDINGLYRYCRPMSNKHPVTYFIGARFMLPSGRQMNRYHTVRRRPLG